MVFPLVRYCNRYSHIDLQFLLGMYLCQLLFAQMHLQPMHYQRESLSGTDAAARAILLHSLPTEPRISITPRVDDINEIQMFPNQTVLYRPIPQVQDLQANLLYPQASSNRRSFEGARLKINRK